MKTFYRKIFREIEARKSWLHKKMAFDCLFFFSTFGSFQEILLIQCTKHTDIQAKRQTKCFIYFNMEEEQ